MKVRLLKKLRRKYIFRFHPRFKSHAMKCVIYALKSDMVLKTVWGVKYSGPLRGLCFDAFMREIGYCSLLKKNRKKNADRRKITEAKRLFKIERK